MATVTRISLSVIALLGLAARLIWPDLKIDAVTLGLLILAVLPWLSPVFESLELPGGWKAKFRDLERAAEAIPPPAGDLPIDEEEASFLAVRGLDPNLALVGLRIEIEKRLQQLAADRGLEPLRPSARATAQSLSQAGVLPPDIAAALNEIIQAGNAAAHGQQLPPGLESFAFEEGPRILAWLDQQVV